MTGCFLTGVVGGVTVWVVLVVLGGVVSVAVSLFRVGSGGTDGGCGSIFGLVVLGSFVSAEIAGSRWYPSKVYRVVLEWKIVSSLVVLVAWIISSLPGEISTVLSSLALFFVLFFFV